MRAPILSIFCGILTAVAAGFLFNDQFQHTDFRADGVIEGLVFACGYCLAGLATRWK